MRYTLLCLPLVFVSHAPANAVAACGDAALAIAPDTWDATTAVTGDLTADGKEDIVFWKRDGDTLMLYIAACDGDQPMETWRFRVQLGNNCPPAAMFVQVTDVLLDPALVDRVGARGNVDECQHMRGENLRRQSLTDGGARQLRIHGTACTDARFRWSKDGRGFIRIGG